VSTKTGGKLKLERSTTMSDEKNTPQEGEETEVEGHLLNQTTSDQTTADKPDVEGHLLNQTTSDQTTADKPDVEGHMYDPNQTTVDQTTVD
jgi:hypothetical protein